MACLLLGQAVMTRKWRYQLWPWWGAGAVGAAAILISSQSEKISWRYIIYIKIYMMYMIYLKINEDIYPDPIGAAGAVAILISEQWGCGGRAGGKWGQAWLWHCENSNTQTPVQENTYTHICKCIKNTKDGKLDPDILNKFTNTYRQPHVYFFSNTSKNTKDTKEWGRTWTILTLTRNYSLSPNPELHPLLPCNHCVSENVPLQTLC